MSTPTTGQSPAGWYLDPRTPGRTRWWDGWEWTSQLQPIAPVEERAQPSSARAWTPAPSDAPVAAPEIEPQQPYWSTSPQAAMTARVSRGGAGLRPGMYSPPTVRRARRPGFKAFWTLLTCVLVAISVFGYSLASAPSGPATFEADQGESGKMVVSWIDDGTGHLTGNMAFTGTDAATDPIVPGDLSLTGTLHSGQISLVVKPMFGVTLTFLGTLEGDTLSLSMNNPAADGTATEFSLARTSPSGKVLHVGSWTWELPPLHLGS